MCVYVVDSGYPMDQFEIVLSKDVVMCYNILTIKPLIKFTHPQTNDLYSVIFIEVRINIYHYAHIYHQIQSTFHCLGI